MDIAAGDCIRIEDDEFGFPAKFFCIPRHYEDSVNSVLISYGLVQDRIEKLARDICRDSGDEPLILLCVLKGGYRFFNDLSDKIQAICRSSHHSVPMSMEFIRLSSYADDSSTGEVKVVGMSSLSQLEGKNVLVIEDIIDTGLTMQKLLGLLKQHLPKSIKVASLMVRRTPRSSGYRPEYIGFEVPDHFVIGYALDFNEHFRDLNHICILNETGKKKYAVKKAS